MSEKKMIKAAKNFDMIAKVCRGIFGAVGIVCAIFSVLVVIFGEKMMDTGTFSLDLDYVKLYLSDDVLLSTGLIKASLAIMLFGLGLISIMVAYGIGQFREILAPMMEGRPFETDASRRIRNIAWTILCGGFVFSIMSFVEYMIMIQAYPMEQIFSSPAISGVEFIYTLDYSFVFVFCGVMFLSYIFDYGQKLQQESDETL